MCVCVSVSVCVTERDFTVSIIMACVRGQEIRVTAGVNN